MRLALTTTDLLEGQSTISYATEMSKMISNLPTSPILNLVDSTIPV